MNSPKCTRKTRKSKNGKHEIKRSRIGVMYLYTILCTYCTTLCARTTREIELTARSYCFDDF